MGGEERAPEADRGEGPAVRPRRVRAAAVCRPRLRFNVGPACLELVVDTLLPCGGTAVSYDSALGLALATFLESSFLFERGCPREERSGFSGL